jgi:hypothetical protein
VIHTYGDFASGHHALALVQDCLHHAGEGVDAERLGKDAGTNFE